MSKRCASCKLSLGMFQNYGNNDTPLCYDCAQKGLKCGDCGNDLEIAAAMTYDGLTLCQKCKENREEKVRQRINNNNEIPNVIDRDKCYICQQAPIETRVEVSYLIGLGIAYVKKYENPLCCCACGKKKLLQGIGVSLTLGWLSFPGLLLNPFYLVMNVIRYFRVKKISEY